MGKVSRKKHVSDGTTSSERSSGSVSLSGNQSEEEISGEGEERSKDAQQRTNEVFIDHPEIFLQMFLNTIKALWCHIKDASSYIMTELGGYRALDKVAQFLARNPYAIYILIIAFILALPFLILMAFALATIVMTFTGFLVLEGTLLTVVSVMLFGCLGALAIVLIFFAVVTVAAYFGFVHIYDLFGGKGSADSAKMALMNYLNKERKKLFPNAAPVNRRSTATRTNINNNIHMSNENIETVA